jgi:D-alanyl-D-alanine carboxypeptidase/D-alanyl-D-alanine-endopeptidase (penicillin-binding protein 4)
MEAMACVEFRTGRPAPNRAGYASSRSHRATDWPRRASLLRTGLVAVVLCVAAAGSRAVLMDRLPPEVASALERAKVPADTLSVVVRDVVGSADSGLAWRADASVNPASLMKLVTTGAALDLLGPAWVWSTHVWLLGRVRNAGTDGLLEGDLVIKGNGDPKLVLERVWLLLRKIRQAGVREIRGDIVLDRTAFIVADRSAAEFDGEPLRPYNAQPDALLLNYKSVILSFLPEAARGVARVVAEPALAGVRVDAEVPLGTGRCDDWRSALKLEATDPLRIHFAGALPAACGERNWPLAYADPASYNARLVAALWRESGGVLTGEVRDGRAPAGVKPTLTFESPPLAEVVRDINKYSNNVMARQLFLTLGLQLEGSGTPDGARSVLQRWLREQVDTRASEVVIDNGAGLSRDARISAEILSIVLQRAWAGPVMPEFVASLPITGADGTLRRASASAAAGRAHLKTGSLRDVAAIAGYLLAPGGRRLVLVAIVNHPNAAAARPALDALVDWAMSPQAQAVLQP